MSPLIITSLLLVSVPIGYLAWSILSVDRKTRAATVAILTRGHRSSETAEKKNAGIVAGIGYRLTPPAYVRKLDRLLSLAGRPLSMPLEKVLGAKIALGVAGASLGLYLSAVGTTPIMKLAGLFLLFLGYFIPDLLLYSKGKERQKAMQLELANTLDQMLISVEAGLGFEGAMARAGENGKGPLADEIVRTGVHRLLLQTRIGACRAGSAAAPGGGRGTSAQAMR